MNFFEVLYAKKNGTALPANFFDLLFAKSFTPATVWGEYDGTLPATYSANGSMLADYRVYGANGGVGDRTVNFFDVTKIVTRTNKIRQENGTVYINLDETGISTPDGNKSTLRDLIGSVPPGTYQLKAITTGINKFIYMLGKNEPWGFETNKTFTSDNIDAWLDSVVLWYASGSNTSAQISEIMIANIFSAEYVPFGYEVDIGIEETQNLWTGTLEQGNIGIDGLESTSNTRLRSSFVECSPNNDYYLKFDGLATGYGVRFYDANKRYLTYTKTWLNSGTKFSTPNNCQYVRYIFKYNDSTVIYPTDVYEIKMTKNIPYSNTTTPIYIGSDPLGEDEYVDYGEGKVYRMSGGTLTPTDPPVPLPALPTVDGTNIVDYAGQSAAPSRFYAKYQRK